MSTDASWAQAFWRDFMEKVWERSPAHVSLEHASQTISSDAVFRALKRASALREGSTCVLLRSLDQTATSCVVPSPCLPNDKDYSLDAYTQRLAAWDHDKPFFVQIGQIHKFDASLWNQVRDFAGVIYSRAGMPARHAWTDVYIGRYGSTPFGVHFDGASNFTFCLVGRKTLYLWEPEFFESTMRGHDARDYRGFLDDAFELTVHAGEAIYWPSRYWHVAESDSELSITMNVAFYFNDRIADRIGQIFLALLRDRLGDQDTAHSFEFHPSCSAGEVPALPRIMKRALDEARAIATDGLLERQLWADWIGRVSRFAFDVGSLEGTMMELDTAGSVRGSAVYPVLCGRISRGTLIVAANGGTTTIVEHPGVTAVVERLNSGRPHAVSELVDLATTTPPVGRLTPSALFEVLRQLLEWGAITVC